ncbi:hypothetical protein EZI54_17290 [Marinobacter halodurans]|uniref:DUF945 family protein n=1 Tax=Marinobacter halodurans TaxID=2528979 RepID=A0ABY1ZKT2_9GAMM|nr:hypothetical protein [Marinobacter halodurans]TBW51276.1 hypothetical protein EZI54_17290 [Marinobacter halodurans]
MKRILIAAVVVIAGGLFFAQYQMTSTVRDQLDKTVQLASFYGQLSYDDVSVTPTGNLEISGIRFSPHTVDDSIRMDKLVLETDNPWVLYTLSDELRSGHVPDHLALNVVGLRIDPHGPLMQAAVERQGGEGMMTQLGLAGCGDHSRNAGSATGGAVDIIDMSLGYQQTQGGSQLDILSRVTIHGQNTLTTQLTLDPGGALNAFNGLQSARSVALKSAEFQIRDQGAVQQGLEDCARETGMSVEAFQKHHLKAWRAVWSKHALAPDDALANAYKQYIEHPGSTLELTIEPFPPISTEDRYLSTDPDYLSGRLNPKVGIDGGPLKPFRISQTETTAAAGEPATGSLAEPPEPKPAAAAPQTAREAPTGPATIAVNELNRHMHQALRIVLNSGKVLEGRLQAVEGQRLQLQRRMFGGNMVVPVNYSDIQTIQRQ